MKRLASDATTDRTFGIGALFALLRDGGPIPKALALATYGGRQGQFLTDLEALIDAGDAEVVPGKPITLGALHARMTTNTGHPAPARPAARREAPVTALRRPPPNGFDAQAFNPVAVAKARALLSRAADG